MELALPAELNPAQTVEQMLGDQREIWLSELKGLFQASADRFDGARAKLLSEKLLADFLDDRDQYRQNTWAAFYTNWKPYSQWCLERAIAPLPSTFTHVGQYLADRGDRYAVNSLKMHVWAISLMHEAAGLPDPTRSRKIKNQLKKMAEAALVNRRYVNQASAFRQAHLQLLTRAWRDSPSLSRRRDLALLATAHATLLRESELANVRFEDVEIVEDIHDPTVDVAVITIPITKTNHSGQPDTVSLRGETFELVEEYLALAGLDWGNDGWLFRPVIARSNRPKPMVNSKGRSLPPLSGLAVDRIFARAHRALVEAHPRLKRIPIWTGHSARVGGAQDRRLRGDSILEIMHAGRWSSEAMVVQYTRAIAAQERN